MSEKSSDFASLRLNKQYQPLCFIKIKVALFSCYTKEYVDFVPFSGEWGADMASWPPLDPPLLPR